MNHDLVIVGSGLFGLTIAERCANELGLKVLVIDKRDHIGGNAYSEPDPRTGIEIHKYGAHLFHTSNERVWEYVNRFTSFTPYVHHVYTTHDGVVYPMPINLGTINQFFSAAYSPDEARAVIAEQAGELAGKDPENLNDKGIASSGARCTRPSSRITPASSGRPIPRTCPLRSSRACPCATPMTTAISTTPMRACRPTATPHGWRRWWTTPTSRSLSAWTSSTSPSPTTRPRSRGGSRSSTAGPLDRYFDYSEGALSWRTIDLSTEYPDTGDFQGTSVMNYPDADHDYTRIIEPRHFHPERDYPADKTVIMKEYSRFAEEGDEPYYPVNTPEDRQKLLAYRKLAGSEQGVVFGGRLGTYKYLDMHMAIGSALSMFDNKIAPHFRDGAALNGEGIEA